MAFDTALREGRLRDAESLLDEIKGKDAFYSSCSKLIDEYLHLYSPFAQRKVRLAELSPYERAVWYSTLKCYNVNVDLNCQFLQSIIIVPA